MKSRKWNRESLINAVGESFSIRQVIKKVGLVPAGGNYEQIKKYIKLYRINSSHFRGKGWSKGLVGIGKPRLPIEKILVKDSGFQSYKLKNRLFKDKVKKPVCEICGWAERTIDGRIPLELDHINGDRHNNRLENIRILCPNCNSLQSTHRGRNIKKRK